MINITNSPVALAVGEELDLRVRRGLKKFITSIYEKYEIQTQIDNKKRNRSVFRSTPEMAIFIYFSSEKFVDGQYGDEFIQALFNVSEIDARNKGLSAAIGKLDQFFCHSRSFSASTSTRIKGLMKLLLLSLWSEKAILLPYKFLLGGQAFLNHQSIIISYETEVASFFRNYKRLKERIEPDLLPLPKSGADSLYKYGPRFIWTSDYHRFEDLNIVEICQLHQSIIKRKGNTGFPIALMLRELLIMEPGRVNYSSIDVDRFVLWSNSSSAKKYEFKDFLYKNDQILEKINSKRANSKHFQNSSELTQNKRSQHKNVHKVPKNNVFLLLSAKEDHESIVEYFGKLRGTPRNGQSWLSLRSPYGGREHIDLKPLSSIWLKAWSAWLKYRKKVQNYDTVDGPNASFNLFCDYLFLYLPWWMELFPDNEVKFPFSPNQLRRSIFIHRSELIDDQPVSIDRLPLTFLDILPFRRSSPDSRYAAIKHIMQFLDWIGIGFEDDERVAGKAYRNPLNNLDLPRLRKKTKTTKVPFTKRVYPHLLFYCYAIEAFGQYLQFIAMQRPELFEGKRIRQQRFLNTGPLSEQVSDSGVVSVEYLEDWPENFGYIPYISYRGKNYPIYRVPNVYQWAKRKINLKRYHFNGDVANCWLPHLTVLRMLIGAVETGLRLQSLQWLDLRLWDLINKRNGVPVSYDFSMIDYQSGHFALPLLITTDKTKEEAWDVLTVFRIRSCFHREQYFRDSINEEEMDTPVDYDGINDSRFGKIIPLFRSHNSPKPVSDSLYSRYWIHLLWGFEEYFNVNVSVENEFIQFVYFKGTDQDKVANYSAVKLKDLLAINTPHACRATYATNRTGILEVSDVAQQLGHGNTVVTAHYTVSTLENMTEKLASAESEIQKEFQFGNSLSSYVRADTNDSSLFKNFQHDRIRTINDFQFAPAVALWTTDDLNSNQDGIEMLKNSPMSQIRFRETHICPVGEACPADIISTISEPRRCGLCPLAMRCIDHLPAIAAKINQLKMSVRNNIQRGEQLTKRSEPNSTTDPYYEAAELDTNELAGWQLSHDILLKMLGEQKNDYKDEYHIQSPDIVKKHLQVVTTNKTLSEFFLQRISEANIYPSMADPEIKRVADRFCRYLLSENKQPSLEDDPVTVLADYIKTQIAPLGISFGDLASRIDNYEYRNKDIQTKLLTNQQFLLSSAQKDEE